MARLLDNRYRLLREIAEGGVGIVHEAEQAYTGRRVAVKTLADKWLASQMARERLLREARALEEARHPGVVALLDAGQTPETGPYLAMELLEGRTLAGILTARRTLPIEAACSVARALCEALIAAQERGVVHRDIKPSNVFVARSDTGAEVVKLIDFGIARLSADGGRAPQRKLTKPEEILGTPEYMAPEQLLAQGSEDHRADVYSLGVTLYECLVGTVPFEGNVAQVLMKISADEPLSPVAVRPEVPDALARAVLRACKKDPEARFPDARAFGAALMDAVPACADSTQLLGVKTAPDAYLRVAPTRMAVPKPQDATLSRRRFARAPYVTPVRIIRSDGTHLDGRSEDISEGGLLVTAERDCKGDDRVEVRFALPMTGRVVRTGAVTRWVRSARRAGAAVGLEFVEPPDDLRVALRAYVTFMGGE